MTLGPHGAMITDGRDVHHEPAFPVAAVDTTGAGDIFRGAFIYGLLRGDEPRAMVGLRMPPPPSAAPARRDRQRADDERYRAAYALSARSTSDRNRRGRILYFNIACNVEIQDHDPKRRPARLADGSDIEEIMR